MKFPAILLFLANTVVSPFPFDFPVTNVGCTDEILENSVLPTITDPPPFLRFCTGDNSDNEFVRFEFINGADAWVSYRGACTPSEYWVAILERESLETGPLETHLNLTGQDVVDLYLSDEAASGLYTGPLEESTVIPTSGRFVDGSLSPALTPLTSYNVLLYMNFTACEDPNFEDVVLSWAFTTDCRAYSHTNGSDTCPDVGGFFADGCDQVWISEKCSSGEYYVDGKDEKYIYDCPSELNEYSLCNETQLECSLSIVNTTNNTTCPYGSYNIDTCEKMSITEECSGLFLLNDRFVACEFEESSHLGTHQCDITPKEEQSEEEQSDETLKQNKKKSKTGLAVGLTILFAVALASTVWCFWRRKSKRDDMAFALMRDSESDL